MWGQVRLEVQLNIKCSPAFAVGQAIMKGPR